MDEKDVSAPSEQKDEVKRHDDVPYERLQELARDRRELRNEVDALKAQLMKMAEPVEKDDENVDPTIRDAINRKFKSLESSVMTAVGNLYYKQEKLELMSRDADLAKYGREIDELAEDTFRRTGKPADLGLIAEVVKARAKDKQKPKEQPKEVQKPKPAPEANSAPASDTAKKSIFDMAI